MGRYDERSNSLYIEGLSLVDKIIRNEWSTLTKIDIRMIQKYLKEKTEEKFFLNSYNRASNLCSQANMPKL